MPTVFSDRQTYGHIRGNPKLRGAIADLYAPSANVTPDDVVVTQGAIAANFLLLFAMCKPGDHVVAVDPTYQQLHELPVSFGAELSRWKLQASQSWIPDLKVFEALLTPRTSLVILNNPNNPTGQLIPTDILLKVVELIKAKAAPGCILHCDEVYRPIFHDRANQPRSVLELGYPHVVATGSLSKAYSLAGLRVGWLASTDKAITESAALRRDYNIISVSTLDDHFASLALSEPARDKIIARNVELANTNRKVVSSWIAQQAGRVGWVEPNAGTTGLISLSQGIDDEQFCSDLHRDTGVLLVPSGRCFGVPGHVRIGYVSDTETLQKGLELFGQYLATYKTS